MTEKLTSILHTFQGLTLDDLSRAPLMNRVDEKFAFHISELPEILELLRDDYDVLNIEGKVVFGYTSQYFDNEDFRFFADHHRAIPNRFKVRIRTYLDTNSTYLEVKEKVKGRTDKNRIKYPENEHEFQGDALIFLESRLREPMSLRPVMVNSYRRITLVNKHQEERLTIDFDIVNGTDPGSTGGNNSLQSVVIAELKQPKKDRNSPFYRLMKHRLIRPFRISKFCFGMMDLYGNSSIKTNLFKSKQLFIKKLSSNATIRRSA